MTSTNPDQSDAAALLGHVLEGVGDSVVVLDRRRRVTVWNAAAARMFGWTAAQMLGQTLACICPPDLDGTLDDRLARVVAGEVVTGEWPARHRHGSTIWVDVRVSALADQGGEVTGLLCVARDVTTLRAARRGASAEGSPDLPALPPSEPDPLLDAAPDALIGTDDVGRITFVNRQAELVFGYARAELAGRSVDMLLPEGARRAHAQHRREYSRDPVTRVMSPGRRSAAGLRRDGTEFPVEVFLSVAEVRGERTTLCTVRDVSERERIEASLRTSIHDKEALLREIYHRVKNNLQVVSSLLSLQAEGVYDARDAVLFRESQGRVRAMALVHEKLCQSGSLADVDAPDYIEDLVRKVRQIHRGGANVTLRVDVDPCKCPVDVAIPVGLILNELLSNALRHAFPGDGGGEVALSLRTTTPGHVLLVVRDDGVGMSPGAEEKKSLGLSLVRLLAKQLGGHLEVRAAGAPGGTEARVDFTLPANKGTR